MFFQKYFLCTKVNFTPKIYYLFSRVIYIAIHMHVSKIERSICLCLSKLTCNKRPRTNIFRAKTVKICHDNNTEST